jgi:hypothetical protein
MENSKNKKKKRFFVRVGDIRIAPDIISAYGKIQAPANPTGVQIIFPNGRYLEIKTTPEEQEKIISLLDELKEPVNI